MLPRSNSIVFIASWLDACAFWRAFTPHLNLPGSRFFIFAGKPDIKQIVGHDIAVLQRMCTQPQYEFMKVLKQTGMKIIMDLDDLVFKLPDYNPVQGIFDAHAEGFKHCLRAADVISVSTKELAAAVREHVRPLKNDWTKKDIPIVVTENKIDERFFGPVVKKDEATDFTVGWSGSSSHIGDLMIVEKAVKAVKAERPDITFQIRGCNPPDVLQDSVEHKFWTPVAEFGNRMPTWGWHIGLAPLVHHEFNESKSNIKLLESAYCNTPVLCSWAAAYERFCSLDKTKELKWLLCPSESSWEVKLRELCNDGARRTLLGERANQVMKEHFSWSNGHKGWNLLLETARNV